MSKIQEFQSGLVDLVEEEFEDWVAGPEDYVDAVVDAIMSLAEDVGIFHSGLA